MRLTIAAILATCLSPGCLVAQGKIELPIPMAELENRVKADSNDPAAHYNVALAYWNAKKWDDADRQLRNAIALEPRFAEAHLALAFLPFARDRHLMDGISVDTKILPKNVLAAEEQYTQEYRHAFLINPMVDLRILAANTTSLDYWLMHDALSEALTNYVKGLADCQEGNYADCETSLSITIRDYASEKRLENSSLMDNAYWYRGLAAAHSRHFNVAIDDFQHLIDRDSQLTKKTEEKALIHFPIRTNERRYFLAAFNQAAGNSEEAVRLYQLAIENDLSLYIAHVRLAEIYETRRDFPKAIEERRNAINANPDDASLQTDLGVTLGKAGMFADAETALKSATERLPRSADAWFWMGVAEQQLGRNTAARDAYQKTIALAPSRMQARVATAKQRLAALP
jgi:tetratricopeptide (TPR) repeat protein